MNKFIKALMCLFTVIATSCTSLPDNVRKLDVQIQSLTIANQNNVEGFLLEYSVKHTSSEAMPVDLVKVDIVLNNRLVASYENDDVAPIPNTVTNNYKLFIPANKINNVAKKSLKTTPMLQVQAKATLSILVDDDLDSGEAHFNVIKTYEGVIHGTTN